MTKNHTLALNSLNDLPYDEAICKIQSCCGSKVWSKNLIDRRPFVSTKDMYTKSKDVWRSLKTEDWLESFLAHPQIGSRKANTHQNEIATKWSKKEQSSINFESEKILEFLRIKNIEYLDKFGFIFIICATGKSADKMLEILQKRLKNNRSEEILNAMKEQEKITELRLEKLLLWE